MIKNYLRRLEIKLLQAKGLLEMASETLHNQIQKERDLIKTIKKFLEENNDSDVVYITEDGERKYTYSNIVKLAKGNLQYAELLLERANGYGIETVIEQDIIHDEIVEFKDQYILTGGEEIKIT